MMRIRRVASQITPAPLDTIRIGSHWHYGIEKQDGGLIAVFKNEQDAEAFVELHNEGIRMRHDPNYLYECEVVRVVDGDTIDVEIFMGFYLKSEQRIRLQGIDTPELRPRHGTEDEREAEKVAAKAAKAFVESACPVGQTVYMYSYKAGKYGRFLGEIYLSAGADVSLNELLIEAGLAKEYTK